MGVVRVVTLEEVKEHKKLSSRMIEIERILEEEARKRGVRVGIPVYEDYIRWAESYRPDLLEEYKRIRERVKELRGKLTDWTYVSDEEARDLAKTCKYVIRVIGENLTFYADDLTLSNGFAVFTPKLRRTNGGWSKPVSVTKVMVSQAVIEDPPVIRGFTLKYEHVLVAIPVAAFVAWILSQ